jgi:hypothetical protein
MKNCFYVEIAGSERTPTHPEERGGENPDPPRREREQEQRHPNHPARKGMKFARQN